jgi:uncharacterized protein YneF (UPF0154 family)
MDDMILIILWLVSLLSAGLAVGWRAARRVS